MERQENLIHDDRGQTLQDYLLGVSILLVAVIFTVGYLPSVFDSYDSPTDGVIAEQADRAAVYLVDNYSVEGKANVLKHDQPGGIHRTLSTAAGIAALRDNASLNTATDRRRPPNVNIELVNTSTLEGPGELTAAVESGRTYSYGQTYRNQSAARAIRVVRLANDPGICTPTCWLVVRAW